MLATFAKWFRKASKAEKVAVDPNMSAVARRIEEINRNYRRDTGAWAERPRADLDWVDPMKVQNFVSEEGVGSLATLRKTAEYQIVETTADRNKWIHAGLGELEDFANGMQRKIDAAFAAPMMKAVMWALEGEMAGVTGEAEVDFGTWMETTSEFDFSELQAAA